jgi:hypothetical protein
MMIRTLDIDVLLTIMGQEKNATIIMILCVLAFISTLYLIELYQDSQKSHMAD